MAEGKIILGKNRVEALTDGIYAIALTLAVLTIDIDELPPVGDSGSFVSSLSVIFPQLLHYAIAFFVLISFWMAHHRQIEHIGHVDKTYIWLNVISLFFVALVPFTTDLVGSYSDYPLAITIYAGNLMVIGLISTLSWIYAAGNGRLLSREITHEYYISVIGRGLTVPTICVVIIVFAYLVSADYSTLLFLLIPFVKSAYGRVMPKIFTAGGNIRP